LSEVETLKKFTIEDVCTFLNCPQHHSLKSLVYKSIAGNKEEYVLAMLLGDDSLNEIKLQAYLKADHIIAATDEELKSLNLQKGFIGPFGITNLKIVFDKAINHEAYYTIGANKKDFHFTGFNPKRDMKEIITADLRLSRSGDLTLDGKHAVTEKRGIEVGHVFQLGDKYTKDMKVGILDQNGKLSTPLMGCYGIGITRVVAASIEQNHDSNGIVWPKAIAPYQVYFATIVKTEQYENEANSIYEEMINAGLEVVYDDRNVGPGVKFKDSDLLGLPFRVVLGERDYSASGELELVDRKSGIVNKIKKENLINTLKELLK
jgi:prolyl-tRNA synthetase